MILNVGNKEIVGIILQLIDEEWSIGFEKKHQQHGCRLLTGSDQRNDAKGQQPTSDRSNRVGVSQIS